MSSFAKEEWAILMLPQDYASYIYMYNVSWLEYDVTILRNVSGPQKPFSHIPKRKYCVNDQRRKLHWLHVYFSSGNSTQFLQTSRKVDVKTCFKRLERGEFPSIMDVSDTTQVELMTLTKLFRKCWKTKIFPNRCFEIDTYTLESKQSNAYLKRSCFHTF